MGCANGNKKWIFKCVALSSFSFFPSMMFYDGIFICAVVGAIWLPKVVHQKREKEGKKKGRNLDL